MLNRLARFSIKALLLFALFYWPLSAYAGAFTEADEQTQTPSLKPYQLEYQANYNFLLPFKGTATREMKQLANGDWLISHQVSSAMVSVKESSLFRMTEEGIRTQEYRYVQKTPSRKKKVMLSLDFDQLQATNHAMEPIRTYAIQSGTLDKLNYQLALRQDLLSAGEPSEYPIADRKKQKNYRFELLGEERLETALGEVDSLKLRRDRGPDAERETIIWLVPAWDYLLAKIKQKEKGKSYSIVIKSGSLDGQPLETLIPKDSSPSI